jgi:hypothetical protein
MMAHTPTHQHLRKPRVTPARHIHNTGDKNEDDREERRADENIAEHMHLNIL